jgi:hypothetical protein
VLIRLRAAFRTGVERNTRLFMGGICPQILEKRCLGEDVEIFLIAAFLVSDAISYTGRVVGRRKPTGVLLAKLHVSGPDEILGRVF